MRALNGAQPSRRAAAENASEVKTLPRGAAACNNSAHAGSPARAIIHCRQSHRVTARDAQDPYMHACTARHARSGVARESWRRARTVLRDRDGSLHHQDSALATPACACAAGTGPRQRAGSPGAQPGSGCAARGAPRAARAKVQASQPLTASRRRGGEHSNIRRTAKPRRLLRWPRRAARARANSTVREVGLSRCVLRWDGPSSRDRRLFKQPLLRGRPLRPGAFR